MYYDDKERLRVTDAVTRSIRELYPPPAVAGEALSVALIDTLCAYVALLGPRADFPDEAALAKSLTAKVDYFRRNPQRNPLASGRLKVPPSPTPFVAPPRLAPRFFARQLPR